MKISGKQVADQMKLDLKKRVDHLIKKGVTPKVAIVTLGPEGAWDTYVRMKLKTAAELGIIAEFINLKDADEATLLKKVEEINSDKTIHGVIVQRPMPDFINKKTVTDAIIAEKDIDGFGDNSPFGVPLWLAAKRLTEESLKELNTDKPWNELSIVVIGKGETAGRPVAEGLRKLGAEPIIIDSKTKNPKELIKNADVVISSVGKSKVVTGDDIKKGTVLIGVGTHVEDGKLRGDYIEEDIESVAGAYTPTPFGVGPVNLTYLFINLVDAAENQSK